MLLQTPITNEYFEHQNSTQPTGLSFCLGYIDQPIKSHLEIYTQELFFLHKLWQICNQEFMHRKLNLSTSKFEQAGGIQVSVH